MSEFDPRLCGKVGAGAGALHQSGKAGHVVSLDVRLEHGRDRRSNRGSAVDVLIHEVGVWIDDRELAVRQAAEEVAGARTLVVQERAQDHRNLLVRQADTATGRPACRHSGKPTSSRRAARPRARRSLTASSAYTQYGPRQ